MAGLDTALRNRITGAVILVLIAVLLLPELLTGAGGAASSHAATGSRAGGVPLTTLQIDLSDPARGSGEGVAPATEALAPEVQLPVPEAVPQAAPEAAPQTAPDAAPQTVPQAAPQAAPEATPRPPAPATPAPLPAPVPAGTDLYFVQVGTFTTRERAEAAERDLTRRGFKVIINQTDSGSRRFHRVRVGPVADREAAVALELKLRPLAPDRAIVAVPASPW